MIEMIRVRQTRNLLRAQSSLQRFGPAPRITIPASGTKSAARTGLTKDRT